MRKLKNEELGRASVDEYKGIPKNHVVIVLDNVRSMNNVGSAFRTADAFLIEKIYLCGITATPPHREINKTALGATESVEWVYVKNTQGAISQLKSEGYQTVSIEQAEGSEKLNDFIPQKDQKLAIIFGNEVFGVEQEVVSKSDIVIEIPQFGTKHSLNISVSIGIVIWDILTKMNKL